MTPPKGTHLAQVPRSDCPEAAGTGEPAAAPLTSPAARPRGLNPGPQLAQGLGRRSWGRGRGGRTRRHCKQNPNCPLPGGAEPAAGLQRPGAPTARGPGSLLTVLSCAPIAVPRQEPTRRSPRPLTPHGFSPVNTEPSPPLGGLRLGSPPAAARGPAGSNRPAPARPAATRPRRDSRSPPRRPGRWPLRLGPGRSGERGRGGARGRGPNARPHTR